eukprot:Gb_40916 [translate_table: standard]
MDSMQPEKERLDKAFADLDTQRAVLVNCTIQWKELRDHFTSLEQSLESKFQELAEKEKTLELKTKETQELLDKREQSIEANEQASLARVQHQKEAALEAIKNNEEFTGFDSKPGSLSPGKSEGNTLPQLKSFCEKMDAEGLWKFLVDHKKDVSAVRAELPSALQCAIDPAKLVLQCLEGFSPFDQNSSKVDKKNSGLPDQRRACSMLLESLVPVLADPNLGADHPAVSSNLKEQAKGIANEWKSRIDIGWDPNNVKPFEVQAFLQLLATFGIASEFEKDDLCKFVLAVSWRRQIPKLCSSLGLSEKMQDIVEELVNKGREIEAVYFAHASGLFEKFPPVPLLKAYLKNSKKDTLASLKSGNDSVAALNEANTKELTALRAVIKCIEEHKLEYLFPPDSLQKRLVQLEKTRAERKRSGGNVKSQNKRPRPNGGGSGAHMPSAAKAGRTSNAYASDMSFYRRPDRIQYPVAAAGLASYNLPGQSNYDRSSQGVYGSSYGVGNRSPVSLSKNYAYPSDDLGSSLRGSGSYSASANYSNYHFGSGAPPPAY